MLTDPYNPGIGIEPTATTKADVVTISHDAPGHSDLSLVKGSPYVLSTPGEYEIGGTFITGVPLHHVNSPQPRYNVGYLFNHDGLTVLHVGDLAHVPEQSVVEELGEVNVLLLPIGGGNTLSGASAADVVALIEPNYIVPMHYALPGLQIALENTDKFLKAMGVSSVQEAETLRVTSGALPEQPQVVLLTPNV